MYMFQSVLHSLVTLFIVERALDIWDVKSPVARFRYRVSVIVLPVFMFPVFQHINPERGSFYFRQESAVFDGSRWLGLELWGGVPVGIIFFTAALMLTTAVMFLQEIAPILRESLSGSSGYASEPAGSEIQDIIEELLKGAEVPVPDVEVIDEERPVIFSTGTREHSILLSNSLIHALDRQQLKSALAHELAHIIRRSNMTTFLIFLMRIVMFYNPVSLIVFRRIVQDDEHVCDDITVSITGEPAVLASTLKVFYSAVPTGPYSLKKVKEVIENSSHNLLLKERITRLENEEGFGDNIFRWERFALTMAAVAALSYFVV